MSISSSVTPEAWHRGEYFISTDRALIDLDAVHRFLSDESYWSRGVTRDVVARSIEHSVAFGLYHETPSGPRQAGFARAITDLATIAYVADVFVLPEHRGRGLGVWMMECMRAHAALQDLRIWRLATADAHSLYEKFGFRPLAHPERMMEIVDAEVYAGAQPDAVRSEGER